MDLRQIYQDFSVVAAAYLPAIQWAVDHAPYRYHALCRADERLCRAREARDERAFAQHLNVVKEILREAQKRKEAEYGEVCSIHTGSDASGTV